MKHFKKIMALALAMVMVLAMGMTVFAEGDGDTSETPAATTTSTPSITINAASTAAEGQTDTAQYTWYRILEADIASDPTQNNASQTGGKVAYYVTTQDRANALAALKMPKTDGTPGDVAMFEVTQVGTTDKWYVSLKSEATDAADIETAFKNQLDLTNFESGTFAQAEVAGTATSGTVAAGYYYITSTAGMNAVVQTLTAVTINEKNTYPPVTKTVADTDKNAQIGDEITYTLTVAVPESANDVIVLTDTMTTGLTFKSIDSCKSNAEGTPDVAYITTLAADSTTNVTLTAADVTGNTPGNTFYIKFTKDTVVANRGKTITITYKAVLNNQAVVGTADKNTVTLKYGNNYVSVPKETETKTYSVKFDKVDGDDTETKLTGAQFKLTKNSTATKTDEVPADEWINLIQVEAGKTYRVAMSEDTDTPVTVITTNGNTVTINGLDADTTYYLWETKAPTGYNVLESAIEVKAKSTTSGSGDSAVTTYSFEDQTIKNKKGSVLPSTGGIGTTIFYIVGAVLVIGAGVLLISRRRMR